MRLSLYSLLAGVCLLVSCVRTQPDYGDQWDLTPHRRDSIRFTQTHHYAPNFNFKVLADSLVLLALPPVEGNRWGMTDSAIVYGGDRLVVADFRLFQVGTSDSVWIKVARDQQTMGWIREHCLLDGAVPDDPISSFIHWFSNRHRVCFLILVVIGIGVQLYRIARRHRLRMVHFNDIDSFYPTLLCISVSGSATLYASMRRWAPHVWDMFYFHPTLNPFGVPLILGTFLASVWLVILVGLAAVDDVHRRLSWDDAIPYLFGLLGVCMVLYLFFTLTVYFYIGYLCLATYWTFAFICWNRRRGRYLCGACGGHLRNKGRCPHCGAWNE